MRDLIMSGGMALQRAVNVLNALDDDLPWSSKIDYLRALAAIAAAFPAEMSRKTYAQGRTIGHILWSAASPERLAWQWNAIIARRSLPREWMTLLPSGTASNESLHAEINRWWRNSPELFPSTLELHLDIGHFGKLLSHNAALYHPTLRQVRQEQVLALALHGVRFQGTDWDDWRRADGGRAELPLFGARVALSERIAAASDGKQLLQTRYTVSKKGPLKRPAASRHVEVRKTAVPKGKAKPKGRRTPFSLKRRALG